MKLPILPRTKALFIASIVVLLALIVGLGYLLVNDRSTATTTTSTPTASDATNTPDTPIGAQAVVEELRTKMTGDLQKVDATTQYGGTGVADGIVYSTAAYQSGQQKFAVYPSTAYGFGTMSTVEAARSDKDIIITHLIDNDFTQVAKDSDIYASATIVCAAMQFNDNIGGHDGVGLGCANSDSYAKNYQAAEPFYNAYTESSPESTDSLVITTPVIKDGVDGHKNAYVDISLSTPGSAGGFVGLFYFTPSTNEWSFFMGTQNDLGCELFTTDTLKKAFDGQRCIDPATQDESTV